VGGGIKNNERKENRNNSLIAQEIPEKVSKCVKAVRWVCMAVFNRD